MNWTRSVFWIIIWLQALGFFVIQVVLGEIVIGATEVVDIQDNCTVGDLTSCPANTCCVRDSMGTYYADNTPRPVYLLQCVPLPSEYEPCVTSSFYAYCPCEAQFVCRPVVVNGTAGHCRRIYNSHGDT